jgi:hypothetical protein
VTSFDISSSPVSLHRKLEIRLALSLAVQEADGLALSTQAHYINHSKPGRSCEKCCKISRHSFTTIKEYSCEMKLEGVSMTTAHYYTVIILLYLNHIYMVSQKYCIYYILKLEYLSTDKNPKHGSIYTYQVLKPLGCMCVASLCVRNF